MLPLTDDEILQSGNTSPAVLMVAENMPQSSSYSLLSLRTKRRIDLKSLCDMHGIRAHGRRKEDYVQAIMSTQERNGGVLVAFQPTTQPQPSYMRRHKGPQTASSLTKHSKLSARRWEAITDSLVSGSGSKQYGKTRLSVEWATNLLKMDEEKRSEQCDASPMENNDITPSSFHALPRLIASLGTLPSRSFGEGPIEDQLDKPLHITPRSLLHLLERSGAEQEAGKDLNLSVTLSNAVTECQKSLESTAVPPRPADIEIGPRKHEKKDETHALRPLSLSLANNVTCQYLASDVVSPPPSVSTSSIDYIASIWDDNAITWVPENCPLILKGKPIPMYLWRQVYQNNRHMVPDSPYVWRTIKQSWLNCAFLAREYLCMGEKSFWEKWSVSVVTRDGNKQRVNLSSTAILHGLQEERKVLDASEARKAGDNIDFMKSAVYIKNNIPTQISHPQALARRYKRAQLSKS